MRFNFFQLGFAALTILLVPVQSIPAQVVDDEQCVTAWVQQTVTATLTQVIVDQFCQINTTIVIGNQVTITISNAPTALATTVVVTCYETATFKVPRVPNTVVTVTQGAAPEISDTVPNIGIPS
jgi:hypothetical protein